MTVEPETVEVQSVTYSENGTRTVEINCPHCLLTHEHSWPIDDADIGMRQGHCGNLYDVAVPTWAQDTRYRYGYAKYAYSQPHSIAHTDTTDRDDNAMHVPVNNWEE
jgi:hypothetical protein